DDPHRHADALAWIVVPGVDKGLEAVRAALRHWPGRRSILRRLHRRAIENIELALLAAANQTIARQQEWSTRAEIGVAIVQRRPVADRVVPAQGQTIGRRRPDIELDQALAKIAGAEHRAVAGLKIDAACAIGDDAFAGGPDSAAPPGSVGRGKDP